MSNIDVGSYYFIANPVGVSNFQDACQAVRDSLANEYLEPGEVEDIIDRFKARIREVKSHG